MPRQRVHTAETRSCVSLDPTANRNPLTNKRRLSCWEPFASWVFTELEIPVTESTLPPAEMNLALIGYGKYLSYAGHPKYTFAETINPVIDPFPSYQGLIGAAWQTLKKWEEAEPIERSMVMPAAILRAAIAVATFCCSYAPGISWPSQTN